MPPTRGPSLTMARGEGEDSLQRNPAPHNQNLHLPPPLHLLCLKPRAGPTRTGRGPDRALDGPRSSPHPRSARMPRRRRASPSTSSSPPSARAAEGPLRRRAGRRGPSSSPRRALHQVAATPRVEEAPVCALLPPPSATGRRHHRRRRRRQRPGWDGAVGDFV
jgi:hypothetical protein